MTHIVTEQDELTSTFDHASEKGTQEWEAFRVQDDSVEIYENKTPPSSLRRS